MLTIILIIILVVVCGASCAAYQAYDTFTVDLPPHDQLIEQQFQFQTTSIYGRNGELLWEVNDPNFGRRTYVPLDKISEDLKHATIATEDRNFYEFHNVGIDFIAILRAFYYNTTEGEIVSGASTITQQVARNVLLSQEERTERNLTRKIREGFLAIKLNNEYSKDQILEVYLNQTYYGNLAYGIEAASQTYFGKEPLAAPPLPDDAVGIAKSARALTLAEASLLAGLPQSPAFYDPYSFKERASRRQEIVLSLMVEAGYINEQEAQMAMQEPVFEQLIYPSYKLDAPHFVSYVLAELEANPPEGYSSVYEAGLKIQTTLDAQIQAMAEEVVAEKVNELASKNVTNGALVAISPQSGQILAMVGSKDFWNNVIAGQVNMAVSPRQPGSAIKPLVYLAAFERGWTPATMIMDVRTTYPDGMGGFYEPINYDLEFHGPVSLRIALANSYNIPAVKTLDFVGIEALKEMATRLGVTTLTRQYYGLSLALGSGEIPLVEMTGAYQVLANEGLKIKPHAIGKVFDSADNDITPPPPKPEQVLHSQHVYLMTSILSDNDARTIEFGPNSPLKLSRPSAAKTGTTNDFRDNLTFGYTPDVVIGVWVGNANYSPMQGTTGLSGAAPIWHEFMERFHEGKPVKEFARPSGIVEMEVCAYTRMLPASENDCPNNRRLDPFVSNQLPNPEGETTSTDTNLVANIISPSDGQTLQETVKLYGTASGDDFAHYVVEIGQGVDPQGFVPLTNEPQTTRVEGETLYIWNTNTLSNRTYTIRLVVRDKSGNEKISVVRVGISNLTLSTSIPTPLP